MQGFVEVESTDPTQQQRWLDKHGFKPDAEGRFAVDTFEGKTPVTTDKLFENIRANVSTGWYESLYAGAYDERTFVMVCGGPSLAKHLEEIRARAAEPEKYLVACSNMTGGYLLSQGITPHVHFVIDPQEKKQFDIAPGKTNPETQYWINVACNPKVFEILKDQGIKPYGFLADFDADGKALQAVKESMRSGGGMMAIQGGTMAGLRAMNLADALGFRSMEYYGFDGAVEVAEGKARPYAYEKKRGEAIITVKCDRCPSEFDTTLILQKQVNEFLNWRQLMPWIDIKILGGGLIAHSYEHLREMEAQKTYGPQRFSPEYAALQKSLHGEGEYGFSGKQYMPTIFHAISQLAKRRGAVHVLDYGCASGKTMQHVRENFWLPPNVTDAKYDPFVEEYSAEPEQADLVVCTDVLEHVEPECTKAVLDHLQKLTRVLCFMTISMRKAVKELSDGRNAHINLRSTEFWLKEIKKRFVTSEVKFSTDATTLLVVAQSIEACEQAVRRNRAGSERPREGRVEGNGSEGSTQAAVA